MSIASYYQLSFCPKINKYFYINITWILINYSIKYLIELEHAKLQFDIVIASKPPLSVLFKYVFNFMKKLTILLTHIRFN